MLIDWFTVGAQALNFLILVWLMKRFLYKPIIDAIDAREQRIAAEIADADSKREAAQKERNEFQHKNEEFERQRHHTLESGDRRSESRTRTSVGRSASRSQRLGGQATGSSKTRTTESDRRNHSTYPRRSFFHREEDACGPCWTSLEERISDVFTRRVRELSGAAKEEFTNALRSSSKPAVLRSTFALPKEQRTAIQVAPMRLLGRNPNQFRDRADGDQRHRAHGQWTKDRLEHRGLLDVAGAERGRAST